MEAFAIFLKYIKPVNHTSWKRNTEQLPQPLRERGFLGKTNVAWKN